MRSDYVLLVLGQRRSGKTTLVFGGDPLGRGLVDFAGTRAGARTFIYDERGTAPGRSDWLRYETASHLQRWLQAEARGEAPTPGAYYIRPKTAQTKTDFWKMMSPGIVDGTVKSGVPGTYVVDEAHRVARAKKATGDAFKEAVDSGGNDGMSFVLATRRFTRLDRDVRTQASAILSFRQPQEDIDLMRRSFDRKASAVENLEGHEFTLFGDATQELPFYDHITSLDTYRAP
jgi:hypothetical protein